MAERRRAGGQPVGSKPLVVGLVRDHRANDLVYGHVGRLTYIPTEDVGQYHDIIHKNNDKHDKHDKHDSQNNHDRNSPDSDRELDDSESESDGSSMSLGRLLTNRVAGSIYNFQEVARFQAWYPPTARDISGIRTVASQYLNRLLATAPESLVGVAGPLYPGFIEAAQESEQLKTPQTRLPLLSYGEITDMSTREPTGRLALAMATGQSGHALRIVQVRREHWGWHPEGSATLRLANIADAANEGHWCDNALSINQIKFTSSGGSDNDDGSGEGKATKKKPARWVLVQTAAETIVFQPTVHGVPVPENKACACDHDHVRRGPSYLTADPIVRIPALETGGRAHCDVAFDAATDTRPPRLAIIDEAGQWSVWNIVGSTHARKNILLPFLHVRGTFADGLSPGPTSGPTSGPAMPAMPARHSLGHLHRVAWLPPSELPAQSSTLLLGSATAINVTSLDKKDAPLRIFNATHSVGLDSVVDVQVSPTNASHVFVLTTTTIFWLDLTTTLNTAIAPGKYAKTRKPLLLLSCPHLRSPVDKTMKLALTRTKTTTHGGANATLALVYSMRHPEVAVFWFPDVTPGSQASYQQQVFQLARPQFAAHNDNASVAADGGGGVANLTKTRMLGQQAMLLLPRDVAINQSSARLKRDTLGHPYARPGVSVFQVITLGADMALWSSLCASSSGPEPTRLAPFAPVLKRKHLQKTQGRDEKKRRAGAKYFRSSFVVPDEFEEHVLRGERRRTSSFFAGPAGPAGFVNSSQRASRGPNSSGPKQVYEVYNMARLYSLLDSRLDRAAELAYETTDVVRGFENPSPLDVIRQILDIAAEHGSFAYTTLLNISNYEYLQEYGADLTDLNWAQQLFDVDMGCIEDVRVSISSQLQESTTRNGGGASTLYEAMSRLCAIPRVGDGQRHGHAVVRRQGLLAFAAVQLYFSQISMVVMPRGFATTSARTTPGFDDGALSAASTPYAAHFPLPDAEPRLRHNMPLLPSSSPVRSQQSRTHHGGPSWLPSSSQGGNDGGLLSSDGILPSLEDDGGGGGGNNNDNDNDDTVLPENQQQQHDEEDPVVARLRQYAKSIRSEPPRKLNGELRLLSHWPLGSDPALFHWVPMGAAGEAEEELRRQARDASDRKRRKMERRAMRDRERLLLLSGVGGGGAGGGGAAASSQMLSSQMLSSQMLSSQPAMGRASPRPTMASQVFSSQVLPSSQPVIRTGGAFGSQQRPKKKKKPMVARGFK